MEVREIAKIIDGRVISNGNNSPKSLKMLLHQI
jgi:hypothetical protein